MRIQPCPQPSSFKLGRSYSGEGDPGAEKIEADLLLLTLEAERGDLKEVQ